MSSDDREIEIYRPPAFLPGDKVVARKHVKNDGTLPGCEIGAVVVKKGEVGHVRDIGTFLGQFYIYGIEFIERAVIVGMREHELTAAEPLPARRDGRPELQPHIVTREMLAQSRKETAR